MAAALQQLVDMTAMECGKCGISFHVPEIWRSEKQRNGDGWYCPNGHSRVYKESDAEKNARLLKEEQERHQRTLDRANRLNAENLELMKKATRLQKRIKAGVCPCCKRTFRQLAAHMHAKHPEFAKEPK